jgi:hypothetical protein
MAVKKTLLFLKAMTTSRLVGTFQSFKENSSALKMEALIFSEAMVSTYECT